MLMVLAVITAGIPFSAFAGEAAQEEGVTERCAQELVDSLAESGLKTLTMAPEAGSSRMRAIINKGIEAGSTLRRESPAVRQ